MKIGTLLIILVLLLNTALQVSGRFAIEEKNDETKKLEERIDAMMLASPCNKKTEQ